MGGQRQRCTAWSGQPQYRPQLALLALLLDSVLASHVLLTETTSVLVLTQKGATETCIMWQDHTGVAFLRVPDSVQWWYSSLKSNTLGVHLPSPALSWRPEQALCGTGTEMVGASVVDSKLLQTDYPCNIPSTSVSINLLFWGLAAWHGRCSWFLQCVSNYCFELLDLFNGKM